VEVEDVENGNHSPLPFSVRGACMARVLPANAIEVSHNKEAFCLIFRFQAADAHQEAVYISISPAGAKTTSALIGREIQEYERETGLTVAPWEMPQSTLTQMSKNHLSS